MWDIPYRQTDAETDGRGGRTYAPEGQTRWTNGHSTQQTDPTDVTDGRMRWTGGQTNGLASAQFTSI